MTRNAIIFPMRRDAASVSGFDPFPYKGNSMNTIIYIVGLVVVVGFLLSFFGLR